MNQAVAFVSFIAVWSFGCSLLHHASIHPVAIFAVWVVGFLWGVGYIAAGKAAADLLLKRWLQMMACAIVIGFVGSSLFS